MGQIGVEMCNDMAPVTENCLEKLFTNSQFLQFYKVAGPTENLAASFVYITVVSKHFFSEQFI